MEKRIEKQHVIPLVVRWTARILSIASLGLVVLFIVGEGFNPAQIRSAEWLGLLFFPIGISLGMILAWWKESVGGCITVGSLILFYIVHLATSNKFPHGWAWLVFSAPGFLFLLYWYLTRRVSTSAA